MIWRTLLGIVIVLVLAFAGFNAWTWRGAMPALAQTPAPASFPREQVERGAQLAGLGDCTTCHTSPGGKSFAGGVPAPTPFGTLYATNITPDRDTGIGTWPEDAFRRALREGVGRKGTHYYPAFPYDHFTNANDEDIKALYAFLMTREPVHQPNRVPQLAFPLNWRFFAAAWQVLFLREGPYQATSSHDPVWNRGAYLTNGLGHCGACHTPRNWLGAETGDRFGGGVAENWVAPALNAASPAPVPWTADKLYAYLRHGFSDQHGAASGPMRPVVQNMQQLPDEDVRAIAIYIASFASPQDKTARERQTLLAQQFAHERAVKVSPALSANATTGAAPTNDNEADGALIFAGACATCHHEGGQLPFSRPLPLALSSVVNEPAATNFVRIVQNGIHPPPGQKGAIMPGFAGALTNAQIAALANYVRQHYSQKPAWGDVSKAVSASWQQTASRESQ